MGEGPNFHEFQLFLHFYAKKHDTEGPNLSKCVWIAMPAAENFQILCFDCLTFIQAENFSVHAQNCSMSSLKF